MKKYIKYMIFFLLGISVLSMFGRWFYVKWHKPDTLEITLNLEESEIEKIECCNSYFPKDRNVVITDLESRKMLCQSFNELSFTYYPEKKRKEKKGMKGGYLQLLEFYNKENTIVLSVELESSTEIIRYSQGYRYHCMIPQDSELSELLEAIIDEYWAYARPWERTGRWDTE